MLSATIGNFLSFLPGKFHAFMGCVFSDFFLQEKSVKSRIAIQKISIEIIKYLSLLLFVDNIILSNTTFSTKNI